MPSNLINMVLRYAGIFALLGAMPLFKRAAGIEKAPVPDVEETGQLR